MQEINIENTVTDRVSKETTNTNSNSYSVELMNTWAFRARLSDYGIGFKLLILLARLVTLIFYSLFFGIKQLAILVVGLCNRSRLFKWVFIIAVILGIVGLIDFVAFYGKVYPGVYVGEIDLSGKTIEEAEVLINDTYSNRLSSNDVVIYINEEAQAEGLGDETRSGIAEELSVEQARETVRYWKTNAVELEANLPSADLADQAVNSTRGLQNIFERLGALMFKKVIAPYADFNSTAVQSQIDRVNDIAGTPFVNPTCTIEDGEAVPHEGSDGNLVNDQEFIDQLNKAFFEADPKDSNFVPKLYLAKQQVSFEAAKKLAEKINTSLLKEVSFSYRGNNWTVDKLNLSKWINVEVQNRMDEGGCSCASVLGSNYCICALVDSNQVGADILAHTRDQNMTATDYSINFIKDEKGITVKTQGNFDMPAISEAVEALNDDWLNNAAVYELNKWAPQGSNDTEPVFVEVDSTKVPEMLSLDSAISIGVVSTISTYTTTYSSGAGTENRNHNITLGASFLNYSICPANNGRWSFNEVVGNCNAEKGFLEAGAIWGNRYTKSIGGGICQVATTVFNAVYDSGFAITARYNHDLHIASYPVGRDAAINYPDLDLVWRNDSTSDVLMTESTTGYSITVNLLGVNPGYTVKSEEGQWVPGEPYKQEYVVDPEKEPNSEKVQTSGSDGKSIVVKRLVYNRNGELIRTDEFKSNYKPKSEIIVLGPGDKANQMLAAGQARMKDETDNW